MLKVNTNLLKKISLNSSKINQKIVELSGINESFRDGKNIKINNKRISMDEFKELRSKKLMKSEISTHTIIDYSLNRSNFFNQEKSGNKNDLNHSVINLINKKEKERNEFIKNKLKIKNEQIRSFVNKNKSKILNLPVYSN